MFAAGWPRGGVDVIVLGEWQLGNRDRNCSYSAAWDLIAVHVPGCSRRQTHNAFQISTLQTASSPSSAFYLQTVKIFVVFFSWTPPQRAKLPVLSIFLSTVACLSAELLYLRRNFVPRGEGQAWEGNGLTHALDLLVAQCLSWFGISTFACVFTVSSNLCMGFLGLTNMI